VSQHIGDLESGETLPHFEHVVSQYQRLFGVQPEVIAHDLHPEYLSTKLALDLDGVELVAVQHHHAHLAACLAEHGVDEPAAGAIYDGTGLGTDGAIWGGEILVGDLRGFTRAVHLHPVRLPGGEDLEIVGFPLPPGYTYGCMAEGLLLGFEGVRDASFTGSLALEQVRRIEAIAERHGFALADCDTVNSYNTSPKQKFQAAATFGNNNKDAALTKNPAPADPAMAQQGRPAGTGAAARR